MKLIKLCPKCKKELIKEVNLRDYPYLCTDCDKSFYEVDVIQKIVDYTEDDIEFILSLNLNITPFCTVLTPEDYYKYINGEEKEIGKASNSRKILNDYILIKHTGEFSFMYYGRAGLTELKPSIDPDGYLSFGMGIYCYADTHIPVKTKNTIYKGTYNGDYLECMYDADPSNNCDKGYGNTKEYLLLTNERIPVEVYKSFK